MDGLSPGTGVGVSEFTGGVARVGKELSPLTGYRHLVGAGTTRLASETSRAGEDFLRHGGPGVSDALASVASSLLDADSRQGRFAGFCTKSRFAIATALGC